MNNRLFLAIGRTFDYSARAHPLRTAMDLNTKSTMASTVADDIRRRIVSGDFVPDEKLRVGHLADMFGVTLSPIREALNRLTSEGLVQLRDMRGFSVAPVSEQELAEISRTRQWLNERALRESIEHGDDAWAENVLLTFHRLQQQPRIDRASGAPNRAWDEAHRCFHVALTAACRSRHLVAYCDQLFVMADRYRYIARSSPKASTKGRDTEHRLIMEAAIARRADDAVALLNRHFDTTAQLCQSELQRRSGRKRGARA
jgi:GntR family transcriptional regulator, carbon starvation induced regulator